MKKTQALASAGRAGPGKPPRHVPAAGAGRPRRTCPPARSPSALGLPPNTLTFHFDRLREAGLVTVRRDGRSMIYAARYDAMNALLGYLTENCCQGAAAKDAPQPNARLQPANLPPQKSE